MLLLFLLLLLLVSFGDLCYCCSCCASLRPGVSCSPSPEHSSAGARTSRRASGDCQFENKIQLLMNYSDEFCFLLGWYCRHRPLIRSVRIRSFLPHALVNPNGPANGSPAATDLRSRVSGALNHPCRCRSCRWQCSLLHLLPCTPSTRALSHPSHGRSPRHRACVRHHGEEG